jgi:tetratricopeptide (TPR) repeat protein
MVRPHTRLALALVLALGALSARPAAGKEDWPVPRGPSHEPEPYAYDPKALRSVPADFLDDSFACVLYAGTTYLVEEDGTVENVVHEVTRLNGRKAVEKLGEYRNITYTPSYQKLTLNVARIHKKDGRTVEVKPGNLHLRDVGTDYQVYESDKQLIISFPSLEAGDTVEVKWTVRGKNPEHAGQFFTRYVFGDPQFPVARDELRVRVPRGKSFKHASGAGKVEPVITESGGSRTYRWRADNCRRPPQDDNGPPKEELRPYVMCSTFASWDEVGLWKQRLRRECWKCTPDVARVVKGVTAGLKTPLEKARALTYWVRRNVRYVSVGEKHDYTPHLPGEVLANRFGDCKDTSQLLAVMLREAGLKVELATLGTYDDGQVLPEVPSPWGTHAILLVTAGKEHWVDTTVRLAGWDYLPHGDRDRQCYLADERGKVRLVRTPPLSAADYTVRQTTEVWVGSDGSSRCRRTITSFGSAAMAQRDAFLEVPPGERRRQVTSELQDSNSRTRLVRLEVSQKELGEFDRPVRVGMEFEIPKHFGGQGGAMEGSVSDPKVWGKFLAYNLDYERDVALVFYAPYELEHRYVIHLHPALALEGLPRDRTQRSRWGRFSVTTADRSPGGTTRDFEVVFRMRLDRTRVEPEDLEEFRKFQEGVARDYRVWLTLRPAADESGVRLLEGELALAPGDNLSAAALARVYLRKGQRAEARRVLERARYYSPEDANLWELAVDCAETPKAEESARRELVRRFPDESRYALSFGGYLVAQGRQEEARKVLASLTRKGSPAQRAQAHYQLARSYYRRDELKPALAHLERAAKEDAEAVNVVRVHLLRARVLEELGRPADAAKAYAQALEVNRDSEEALLSLIRLAILADRKLDALEYLRRYTLLVRDDLGGLLLAAETYLRLGRYDDAFELASRAREKRFHERAQRVLGLVYLHRGDDERAAQHLGRAEADPAVLAGLLRAHTNLGNLREVELALEKAGRLDKPPAGLKRACAKARAVLRRRAELARVVSVPPGKGKDYAPALDATACAEAVYAAGGPPAKVERLLNAALADGLAVGPALALRGRLALERGRLSKALADAEKAVELSPRDAGGYYVRGRVRLERAAPGALADLEKAAELCGRKDADVLHALAEGLARAGRVEDALAAEREAVKLKPGDREMAEQLRALEGAVKKGKGG